MKGIVGYMLLIGSLFFSAIVWYFLIFERPATIAMNEMIDISRTQVTNKKAVIFVYPTDRFTDILQTAEPMRDRLLFIGKNREMVPEDRLLKNIDVFFLISPANIPVDTFETYHWAPKKTAGNELFSLYQLTPDRTHTFTPLTGGRGGRPFGVSCSANEPFNGLDIIDTGNGLELVALRCKDKVRPLKKPAAKQNNQRRISCMSGSHITGISGTADNYLRSITLVCSQALEYSAAYGPVGKPQGTAFSLSCANTTAADGVFGRAGKVLDSMGLICGK